MAYNPNKNQIKKEISNEDLKVEYDMKNGFMTSYFPHDELSIHQFFEEMFIEAIDKDILMSEGELNSGKANGQLILYSPKISYIDENGDYKKNKKKLVLTKDNIYDLNIEGLNHIFISPALYFGDSKKKNLTYFLNFDIDLDGIYAMSDLVKLVNYFENGKILKPTMLLNSGTGVHLIYRLKTPIFIYNQTSTQIFLAAIKDAICSKLNKILFPNSKYPVISTLTLDHKIRCVGSTTKLGEMANSTLEAKKDIVRAWKLGDSLSLSDIVNFANDYLDKSFLKVADKIKNTSSCEMVDEAKFSLEKFLANENQTSTIKKVVKRGNKTYIRFNKNFYNGWLKKCKDVIEGKRYFALLGVASAAIKCGVKLEELKKDLIELQKYYNKRDTTKVTNSDISAIILSFENDKDTLISLTGKKINKNCGLKATPTKRNGKTQKEHLESIKGLSGRKSKMEEVLEFLSMQKNKGIDVEKLSTREIASLSGISQSTVSRHKKECIAILNSKICDKNIQENAQENVTKNSVIKIDKTKFHDFNILKTKINIRKNQVTQNHWYNMFSYSYIIDKER